jgi:branched-subunit amino acid ABC-type transport system permease component
MAEFLQASFDGLTTGAVYILVAVGLTLGIGVARFLNFAQGQLVVLAGFVAAALAQHHLPFFVSLPVTLVAVGVVGLLMRGGIQRFARGDTMVVFLGTLGTGIIIEYAIVLIWGPDQRSVPTPISGNVKAGGVLMSNSALLLLAISVPVMIALYVLLARSEAGRRLRACAENPEVSGLLGIDVGRTMRGAVLLGSAMAALAGVLIGTLFPFDAFGGSNYLIKGLAVALAGGLGSITGAVVVGLALGLIETYATVYGISVGFYHFGSAWQNGYAFVLMILVLAWRPRGLFRGTGDL